jgi:hypothetical protein
METRGSENPKLEIRNKLQHKEMFNSPATAKLLISAVLLALAVVFFVKFSPPHEAQDDQTYFYDLKEQKLFVAPRSSIPPIPGIKSGEPTGVRAVVISTKGNPKDKSSRQIAYLEKYAPELKRVLEAVQAGQRTDVPPREARQAWIYVRRLADSAWYPVNTPEGEKVMNEWNVPGPDGTLPVVCSP